MIKFHKPVLALMVVVMVGGCQSKPRSTVKVAPVAVKPVDIVGDWRATEGPLMATFSTTEFKSINTENNQIVAAGAYKYNSSQSIRLEWLGALSGRSSASCKLIASDLMRCVPSNGSGFEMRRV